MKFPTPYQAIDLAKVEKAEVTSFAVFHEIGNTPIACFSKVYGVDQQTPLTVEQLILITDAENILECAIIDPEHADNIISIYWDTQRAWVKPVSRFVQNIMPFGMGQRPEMLAMRKAELQLELAVIDYGFIQSPQHQPGSGLFTQQAPNPWLQPYIRPAVQPLNEDSVQWTPQQQQFMNGN